MPEPEPLTRALDRARHQPFLPLSGHYLLEYLAKIEGAVAGIDEADLWWRARPGCNTIGNLLLHLSGNLSLWIRKEVGGRAYERDRDHEFAADRTATRAELLGALREVVEDCVRVLAATPEADLTVPRDIQGFATDVFGAVYHAVEHMAYHTGQILAIAKERKGSLDLD